MRYARQSNIRSEFRRRKTNRVPVSVPSYCGVEIGEAIAATLEEYVKLWENASSITTTYACISIWHWWYNWDITPPHYDVEKTPLCSTCAPNPLGKMKYECYSVFGANQWWWDVNYVLWGAFASGCAHTSLPYSIDYFLAIMWKYWVKNEWSPFVPLWFDVGWNYTSALWQTPKTANFRRTVNSGWRNRFGKPVDNPAYINCKNCPTALPHDPLPFKSPIGNFKQ